MKPKYFATPSDFRAWLAEHHTSAPELWVGFHKVHTGKPSITWPQSVDEALCFGWIDGLRRSLGDGAYAIRFSPRRPKSIWSNVNTKRAAELSKAGLMPPCGDSGAQAARPGPLGYLFVGSAHGRLRPGARKNLSRAPRGVEILQRAAARLSAHGDALGHEREARGDAREAIEAADRRLRQRTSHRDAAPITPRHASDGSGGAEPAVEA